MKKLLLASLLIGASLANSVSAMAPTEQPRRKKSKEAALIKAVAGGYYASIYMGLLSHLMLQEKLAEHVPSSTLYAIVACIGYKVSRQGFNDLSEIAQAE